MRAARVARLGACDAGCRCPECAPCCAYRTCREHADEGAIETDAMRSYEREHSAAALSTDAYEAHEQSGDGFVEWGAGDV